MRPVSAAEALSALLWQPYECRSPPAGGRGGGGAGRGAGGAPQSPAAGRHARASPPSLLDMRLPVPAPAPLRKSDSVCVRVPGEPADDNVNIVYVERCADANQNNSAVQTSERSVASAECQTEEPRRRRRRRPRGCRAPPPPPYCTLPPPLGAPPAPLSPALGSPLPPPLGAAPPLVPAPPAPGVAPHPASQRFPFHPIPLRLGRGGLYLCSEEVNAPKSCCGRPPLRLCGLFLGVVGACLVAAGAVLGALRPQPRAPLTLLLLMIGIGIVLVTAAVVSWRLGGRDGSCVFLGVRRSSCRRLVPRLPPSYARPHHPYAAMMYPEFQYRPPPPSYQASMQEYRLRLLLQDRCVPAVSPPPTYSSNTASLVSRGTSSGAVCADAGLAPPTYRPPRPAARAAADKQQQPPSPLPQEKDPEGLHLVTIVHTDAQPVIVTVSGAVNDTHIQPTSEIDILAHL